MTIFDGNGGIIHDPATHHFDEELFTCCRVECDNQFEYRGSSQYVTMVAPDQNTEEGDIQDWCPDCVDNYAMRKGGTGILIPATWQHVADRLIGKVEE